MSRSAIKGPGGQGGTAPPSLSAAPPGPAAAAAAAASRPVPPAAAGRSKPGDMGDAAGSPMLLPSCVGCCFSSCCCLAAVPGFCCCRPSPLLSLVALLGRAAGLRLRLRLLRPKRGGGDESRAARPLGGAVVSYTGDPRPPGGFPPSLNPPGPKPPPGPGPYPGKGGDPPAYPAAAAASQNMLTAKRIAHMRMGHLRLSKHMEHTASTGHMRQYHVARVAWSISEHQTDSD